MHGWMTKHALEKFFSIPSKLACNKKKTEIVCVAWCERVDLRSVAFPFAVHRKKRGRKLPLLSSGHRLQLGCVSCLDSNEQVLEEVTEMGILMSGFGQ